MCVAAHASTCGHPVLALVAMMPLLCVHWLAGMSPTAAPLMPPLPNTQVLQPAWLPHFPVQRMQHRQRLVDLPDLRACRLREVQGGTCIGSLGEHSALLRSGAGYAAGEGVVQ